MTRYSDTPFFPTDMLLKFAVRPSYSECRPGTAVQSAQGQGVVGRRDAPMANLLADSMAAQAEGVLTPGAEKAQQPAEIAEELAATDANPTDLPQALREDQIQNAVAFLAHPKVPCYRPPFILQAETYPLLFGK